MDAHKKITDKIIHERMHLSYKLIFCAAVCFDYGMVWPAARNSKIPAGEKKLLKEFSLSSGTKLLKLAFST